MSYDLQLGVKVAGAEDLYATIAEPERSSPTYNLRAMFVACMDWDYEQGEWYKVSDVLPKIRHGIAELSARPLYYSKYNASNGWGNVASALNDLRSLEQCILDNAPETSMTWNEVPLDLMYMRW